MAVAAVCWSSDRPVAITDVLVVRWIAVGQIVMGLSLSASYFGSLRYTRRTEEHRLG
jgi:hypothetical protein